MVLIGAIIFLIVIGVILLLLRGKIDPTLYTAIIVIVILAVCIWILGAFGLFPIPAALRIGPK